MFSIENIFRRFPSGSWASPSQVRTSPRRSPIKSQEGLVGSQAGPNQVLGKSQSSLGQIPMRSQASLKRVPVKSQAGPDQVPTGSQASSRLVPSKFWASPYQVSVKYRQGLEQVPSRLRSSPKTFFNEPKPLGPFCKQKPKSTITRRALVHGGHTKRSSTDHSICVKIVL
jgi:hypothetical protein